jgi:hypothetical protein
MKRFHKKALALVVVAIVAVIGAAVGYAYFTNSGSGTGSASVGQSSEIQLSGSAPDNLYPDGPARDVSITIANPGSGSQYVDAVHLASVDAPTGCDASAFSMPDVPVSADLAAGASTVRHGSLSMADNGLNQDACQGGSLVLHFTSN